MATFRPPYQPDRDRPDPYASPARQEFISREEQDIRQALADWFQVAPPAYTETRNIHKVENLLGKILAKLPMEQEGMDPELLRKGWLAAAGDFIGKQANLISIVNGVAIIQVLQPALRYHLKQWEVPLLEKLKAQFGKTTVKAIKIRIG